MLIQLSRIKKEQEMQASVQVLRESFSTVAREFNLTRENAPTNAAFVSYHDLLAIAERGAYLYGLYEHGRQIGFFTLERVQEDLCYLNKVAILPACRHQGYGGFILYFVFEHVKRMGGGSISIGIINENTVLKKWYEDYGFAEIAVQSHAHLPFKVCLMKKTFPIAQRWG